MLIYGVARQSGKAGEFAGGVKWVVTGVSQSGGRELMAGVK